VRSLLARPENLDRRIEQAAELLKIERRAAAEGGVEHRIVRIIRRAAQDPARAAALGREMDDRGLAFGEIGDIAAHVVEQDGEIVGPQGAEMRELRRQPLLPAALGMEMQLEWAEADAEANAGGAAGLAQRHEPRELGLGMRLLPAAAQPGIGLRRVEIEAKAVGAEEAHRLLARRP
jgi:hypothetical protein